MNNPHQKDFERYWDKKCQGVDSVFKPMMYCSYIEGRQHESERVRGLINGMGEIIDLLEMVEGKQIGIWDRGTGGYVTWNDGEYSVSVATQLLRHRIAVFKAHSIKPTCDKDACVKQDTGSLKEIIENIEIICWADNFDNAQDKLNAIDKLIEIAKLSNR